MKKTFSASILLCLLVIIPALCAGQIKNGRIAASPDNKRTFIIKKQPETARRQPAEFFSLDIFTTGLFDSNIDHDADDQNSFGAALGVRAGFRAGKKFPFRANYELAKYSFTNTRRWDRITQNLDASFEGKLSRRLRFETSGNVNLKGSLEDRELANYYSLREDLKYRINPRNRFIFYGAYRIKRYENRLRNASNPYGGVKFEHNFGEKRRLELEYRFERNQTHTDIFSYRRQTFGAEYNAPFYRKNRFAVEAQFRPQRYDSFFTNANGNRVRRQDRKWIFSAHLSVPLNKKFELNPFYRFETRDSNQPGRYFKAHLVGVTLNFHWFGE